MIHSAWRNQSSRFARTVEAISNMWCCDERARKEAREGERFEWGEPIGGRASAERARGALGGGPRGEAKSVFRRRVAQRLLGDARCAWNPRGCSRAMSRAYSRSA